VFRRLALINGENDVLRDGTCEHADRCLRSAALAVCDAAGSSAK
jgi:hypothetical protein